MADGRFPAEHAYAHCYKVGKGWLVVYDEGADWGTVWVFKTREFLRRETRSAHITTFPERREATLCGNCVLAVLNRYLSEVGLSRVDRKYMQCVESIFIR